MSETTKLQQEAIYEMLATEVSYIRQILTMIDIFMTSVRILKSSDRDGIFHDIDMDRLFSNIQEVIEGNLLFWKAILLPIKVKLERTGEVMNPSELKNGFLQVNVLLIDFSAIDVLFYSSRCISNPTFVTSLIRRQVPSISNSG